MDQLNNHDLAWANSRAVWEGRQPSYRAGTGIPANDPPGTQYQIWYKDLTDQGYRPDEPAQLIPGTHLTFWQAIAQAQKFLDEYLYHFGAFWIVPVGEAPGESVAYSMVTG